MTPIIHWIGLVLFLVGVAGYGLSVVTYLALGRAEAAQVTAATLLWIGGAALGLAAWALS